MFIGVLIGILSIGLVLQTGSSFSGTSGTFGVDPTDEKYIEVDDLNVSRDWFRGLVNVTDNILGVLNDLIPDAPGIYDIGSVIAEWRDIWIDGTGYFDAIIMHGVLDFGANKPRINNNIAFQTKTTRGELIDILKVNTANKTLLLGFPGTDVQIPNNNLDMNGHEIRNAGNLGNDLGNTNTLVATTFSGDILRPTNNTGAIGADAVRWANGWFTTMTAKAFVTGRVIENEISPAPWELFEAGDVVKIYDSEYFVKTSKKLDYVVGVVVNNPVQVIDHYDITWEFIPEDVPVMVDVDDTYSVTDMYGNVFEVTETRSEYLYEYYIEEIEYNGETAFFNRSRIVTETIYTNVTTETPVYAMEGSPVLCVAGVAPVKIIEPVKKNDILVAGPNGVARPFRVVIEEIKANYGEIPFNWNNVLEVLENFNMRTLGQVMDDSSGDYAQVMLW